MILDALESPASLLAAKNNISLVVSPVGGRLAVGEILLQEMLKIKKFWCIHNDLAL